MTITMVSDSQPYGNKQLVGYTALESGKDEEEQLIPVMRKMKLMQI